MLRCLLLLLTLITATLTVRADGANRKFTLVIDAGHGGHDAGAIGAFSKEKNINLKVALAFGALVEDNCPDVKVVYTRRKDVFIPLQRRADIANNHKADLFISIHTNSLPKGKIAYGSETYTLGMAKAKDNLDVAKRENSVITLENDYKRTYEGFDPHKAESYVIFEIMQDRYMKQSVDLARFIQRNYVAAGRRDKGVHQAGFLVLRNTSMPSVLTELGFISTPAEERYLNSQKGITELSRGIYNGFLAYRRRYDKRAHELPANLPSKMEEMPELSPSAIRKAEDKTEGKREVKVVPVETVRTADLTPTRQENSREEAADNNERERDKTPERATRNSRTEETDERSRRRETTKAKRQEARPQAKTTARQRSPRVTYRIQVSAGKRAISPKDAQFKGLPVVREKEGDLYKYYYGTCHTYAEALKAQRKAQEKIKGAYMVAEADGKTVSIPQARALEKSRR